MKNLLLLFFLAFLIFPARAQEFRFGVKVGANYSDINGKNLNDDAHRYKLGWHAGAMVNIQYPGNKWFSIQPEVIYTRKGYENYSPETEIRNNQNDLQYTSQQAGLVRFNYIDIPVMLNFKSGIIVFEFGPQISVLAGFRNDAMERQTFPDGTVVEASVPRFDEDRMHKIDLGLATGFRLETHNGVGLGLRFNQGFVKLDNGETGILTEPRAPDAYNQVFQLFASYLIPE